MRTPHIFLQNGLIIPLSLACRNPDVCPASVCKLLIQGEPTESDDNSYAPKAHVPQNSRLEVSVGDRGK
jgi:hypothetical protein